MPKPGKSIENSEEVAEIIRRKYVRYDVGASLYGVCEKTFAKLAKDANATCKYGKVVFVNTEIVDRFLETTCRIVEN